MIPRLNEGGQRLFPTLPDGFRPKQEASWEVLGVEWCPERDLRRRKEKAAPLDLGGRRYGESPEFLTKGQFQRGAGEFTMCLGQGGSGGWGVGGGLMASEEASLKT